MAPYPFRVTLHALISDFSCQKTRGRSGGTAVSSGPSREKKGIRNGVIKTREKHSTVLRPSESRTYFAIHRHESHYEKIVMAISHYFLPADRVVVEKTAKIRDVR